MPRTIIDIPDAQLREVDRICQALKISRAEAVRRGLVEFVRQNESVNADGFGLWRNSRASQHASAQQPSAQQLRERLRSGW